MMRAGRLVPLLLAGTALSPLAAVHAETNVQQMTRDNLGVSSYPAKTYGGTWNGGSGNSVATAVNAARAAANTAGGGEVVLPAGNFYFASQISSNVSGVGFRGKGAARYSTSNPLAAKTKLIYNGPAGAGPGFVIEPPDLASSLSNVDLVDFEVDCGGLLETCVRVGQVSASRIRISATGATKTNIQVAASASSVGPGVQENDMVFWFKATGTSTGLLLDHDTGSTWNVSDNPRIQAYGTFEGGDCFLSGNADNNFYEQIRCFHSGTATTGSHAVFASASYTPPSGVQVKGRTRASVVRHAHVPIIMAGLEYGSVWTENPANTGTLHLAPVTISTNAITAGGDTTLNFASTTGVAAGMDVNCGGTTSGVYPHTRVMSVTATTVVIQDPAVIGGNTSGVASGQSCTFSYHFTQSARAGTYTITYNGATYDIVAVGGGTSQTGVSPSGGLLSFTDLIVPINAGTPVNGDSWTVTAASQAFNNTVMFVDSDNAISNPYYGTRSFGWYGTTDALQHGMKHVCPIFAADEAAAGNALTNALTNTGSKDGVSGGCSGAAYIYDNSNRALLWFANAAARFQLLLTTTSANIWFKRGGAASGGMIVPHVFTSFANQTIATSDTSCLGPATSVNAKGSKTLTSAELIQGNVIRVRCHGVYTAPAGNAATLTPKFKFASQSVVGTAITMPSSVTGGAWELNEECTIQSEGASGSLQCNGDFWVMDGSGVKTHSQMVGTKTIDTTASNTFDATLVLSATPSTQAATSHQGKIEVH